VGVAQLARTCWLAWEFHVRHRQHSANDDVTVSLSLSLCEYWTNNSARFDPVFPAYVPLSDVPLFVFTA